MEEARAIDLLHQPLAWPLARRLDRRNRRVQKRFLMFDYLYRKDTFAVMVAHDFQPDRLSGWVTERNNFEQTYARPIREARDSELNDKTADAIAHDTMPQFNLRNIGRYEMAIDLNDPMPWQRQAGIGGEIDNDDLAEARRAQVPPVEPLQIWTVDYVSRLRAQLRRLVVEDPWDLKYGPEATSVHNGLGRNFVVEGTHPDDMPGADFAPKLIARPKEWQATPKGEDAQERPYDIAADAQRLDEGKSGGDMGRRFEL